jgi:hypothetical protein
VLFRSLGSEGDFHAASDAANRAGRVIRWHHLV